MFWGRFWICAFLALCSGLFVTQAELTIHIIAHSHCDPGWLSTFEGYYNRDVRQILNSVFNELIKDSTKKFVWSETSFFQRWYEHLGVEQKKQFKRLVFNGQLEFVGGGWSQHDEANPDAIAVINQISEGHQYLAANFGVQPRIAWQIDPFGHSSTTPSLFAMMGFQALVINRIHHDVKKQFKQQRHMEFLWRGTDVGTNSDMLTHVLHTHYSAPQGFDWEEHSPTISSSNVGSRADALVNMLKGRAAHYRSSHLLVPFGDDFKFKNAQRQFSNMDQLINYINQNRGRYGVKIQYSTLSDYFQALQNDQNAKFPVYQGDFFPYADNEDSYWTGYYTTRPVLKALSRSLEHTIRSTEALHALNRALTPSYLSASASTSSSSSSSSSSSASSSSSSSSSSSALVPLSYWEDHFLILENARREAALFLHHDSITGTARKEVVNEITNNMQHAITKLMQVATKRDCCGLMIDGWMDADECVEVDMDG